MYSAAEITPAGAETIPVAAGIILVVAETIPAGVEIIPAAAETIPAGVEIIPAAAEIIPAAAGTIPVIAGIIPAGAVPVPVSVTRQVSDAALKMERATAITLVTRPETTPGIMPDTAPATMRAMRKDAGIVPQQPE